jgi:hypothetical protein
MSPQKTVRAGIVNDCRALRQGDKYFGEILISYHLPQRRKGRKEKHGFLSRTPLRSPAAT